jgi:hypothetical protein
MYPTLSVVWAWLQTHEQSIAIWLEGLALVAIFWLELKEYRRQGAERIEQHKESAAQLKIAKHAAEAAKANADALINAERAWIVAELVPISAKFDKWWHRPAGSGWAAMNEEEVLNGDHLRHRLKFTNMGRTPAHVLRYQIGYSREVDTTGTDLRMIDRVKRPEIEFDRLLGGNDSVEVKEVDVAEYVRDSIVAIGDSAATGILSGWVEYQHVFSDTDAVKVPFVYLYQPSTQRLDRVPLRKPEKAKEKQP